MNKITFDLIFLAVVLSSVNIVYKGKVIDKYSWMKVLAVSLWFIVGGTILLWTNHKYVLISINYLTVSSLLSITFIWFIFPRLIRQFGTYPNYYFKNRKNNTRFMAKFELPSMTVKYFEVLFQQTSFLFLLFVVLAKFPETNRIFWFTFLVAIIHLGNLLFMDYKWALFYTALSIPMAVIFGYMILHGYIFLTAAIHLSFYLLFNARYWIIKK